ncbi:DUF937 domain-containing protein [Stappia indica]|uniref:DUF937 domain-containing protein n=1 Tax=Stappia indica TaxID=538381 RepID=UPI0008313025|nr:DUF937 domain-containing protein [Stappia indica]
MTESFPALGAFDPAAVGEAMRRQFGWGESEVARAAEALMPAALAGMRRYAASPSALEGLLALMPGPGRAAALPDPSALVGEPLALIFGPSEVQRSIAEYVAQQTGLELPGVETMMPVVATLALGQAARRFTVGPARELLDAFLAGYARGRPKPVPNPMRVMEPYAQAMRSFWDGYLGLVGAATATGAAAQEEEPPAPEPAPEPTPETVDDPVDEPAADAGSALVDSWLSLGRDIQERQIRSFETLFEQAAKKD